MDGELIVDAIITSGFSGALVYLASLSNENPNYQKFAWLIMFFSMLGIAYFFYKKMDYYVTPSFMFSSFINFGLFIVLQPIFLIILSIAGLVFSLIFMIIIVKENKSLLESKTWIRETKNGTKK